MKINDIIKLEIIDTNENGVGIARHEGMVVFIPGLLSGEFAEVQITSLEKNFAAGVCINRFSSSENRQDDKCPSSGECGGCTLGFTSYESENIIKQNTVRNALRRAGLPYSLVRETVFSPARTGYRNKIVVHYDASAKEFGYRRAQSNQEIPFEGCLLCPTKMSEIIDFTNKHIDLLNDIEPISLQLRTSLDGITVSVYGKCNCTEDIALYKKALQDKFSIVHEVLFFMEGRASRNSQYIHDRVFGLDMHFTSEAFRQVNGAAFEKLLQLVHDFAAEIPFTCAADLYCGSGIIGLSLAKRFPDAKFWGIEINADAVRDARCNADANVISNITFFTGDAATFKKRIPENQKPELIVVDPPRAGLSKEMRRDLLELSPDRIIYVSCNPQTMARDIADLSEQFKLKTVVPVNMFPRTKHVETVCLLSK